MERTMPSLPHQRQFGSCDRAEPVTGQEDPVRIHRPSLRLRHANGVFGTGQGRKGAER